jgi:hypothetical protein
MQNFSLLPLLKPCSRALIYFTTMKFEGAHARNFVGQIFFIPNLLFIGSQEAVKKIWSKNRICHVKKVVEREK